MFFIKESRFSGERRERDRRVPMIWCWEIAAESLWSAVDIYNRAAGHTGDKMGGARTATPWFRNGDRARNVVDHLRNGAVHYNQDYGQGTTKSDAGTENFLWLGPPDEAERIAISAVPGLLKDVADEIGLHVVRVTGQAVTPITGASDSTWANNLAREVKAEKGGD